MDTDKAKATLETFRQTHPPKPQAPRAPIDPGKILVACNRQDGTVLRVALKEYEGRPFLDLRVWNPGELGTGQLLPSKKGVSLKVRELPDVVEALMTAMQELQDRRQV